MEKEEVVLKYYYIQVSSGVIEKHIDIDTNEILDNTKYEGNVGDDYKTEPKEFKNYEIVKEKLPENAEGKMTEDVITVNYYYKKKAPFVITIKYIDQETGEKIEEEVVIKGYEDEEYKTEQKDIEYYEFVKVVGETEGKITENKEIIYYYKKLPEPEIPGEGGDDQIVEEPKPDDTTINTKIPNAGLMKQVIAISVAVVMIIVVGVLIVVAVKEAKLDKKFKK